MSTTGRPSVAVVVLDTLRKDAFDDHFGWLDAVHYENAYSTSHWTVPAHASLFTGRYAIETGVHAQAPAFDYPGPVLPEQLQEAGYTTRAFSANVNVSEPFEFDRGFDDFAGNWRVRSLREDLFDWKHFIDSTRHMGPARYPLAVLRCITDDCATLPSLKTGLLLKARDLNLGRSTADDGATEALDYVRETRFGDREFLFVNLMEAHTPYNPPADYRTVEPPHQWGLEATLTASPSADAERIRTAYRDSVRYLSDMYREIHAELVESFDYVVTLSDHGEMLGEYGAWEHICGLYPQLTHVPLAVSGQGADDPPAPERRLTSIFDVHRTVCELTGVDATPSRGRSLLADTSHQELLTEYHGLGERRRSSLEDMGFESALIDAYDHELHGLATLDAYAFESPTTDGFDVVGDGRIDDPEARVGAILAGLERRDTAPDVAVSAAVERQLEDLGYG